MKMLAAMAAVALLWPTTSSFAKNELVILSQESFLNVARIEVDGDANSLTILQEHKGGGAANVLDVSLTGDGNGGPLGAAFTGAALSAGLQPGTITQRGFGNMMAVDVTGSRNLFAFAQNGSENALSGTITGMNNQAVVSQTGYNNFTAFSQTGNGNTISVMQTSW